MTARVIHGIPSRYNRGCRCNKCTVAHREAVYRAHAKLQRKPFDEIPHGLGGYTNYACRCETCTKANSAACLARYHRTKNGVVKQGESS